MFNFSCSPAAVESFCLDSKWKYWVLGCELCVCVCVCVHLQFNQWQMKCVACVETEKMRGNALHFWIYHFLCFAVWKLYISFVCLILVFYPPFGIDVRHVSVYSSLGRNKYSNIAIELQNIQVEVASELVASFFFLAWSTWKPGKKWR